MEILAICSHQIPGYMRNAFATSQICEAASTLFLDMRKVGDIGVSGSRLAYIRLRLVLRGFQPPIAVAIAAKDSAFGLTTGRDHMGGQHLLQHPEENKMKSSVSFVQERKENRGRKESSAYFPLFIVSPIWRENKANLFFSLSKHKRGKMKKKKISLDLFSFLPHKISKQSVKDLLVVSYKIFSYVNACPCIYAYLRWPRFFCILYFCCFSSFSVKYNK